MTDSDVDRETVASVVTDLAASSRQFFSARTIVDEVCDDPDDADNRAAGYHLEDIADERDDVGVWSAGGRRKTYQFVTDDAPEAMTDGGSDLPTVAEVAREIRACDADGLTHVKVRHIAARLDDYGRDETGVARAIGKRCSTLVDRGALEQWSAGRGGGRTVWEIVDVDALPEREVAADGGQGPMDRATRLRQLADEIEQTAGNDPATDGGTAEHPERDTVQVSRATARASLLEIEAVIERSGGDDVGAGEANSPLREVWEQIHQSETVRGEAEGYVLETIRQVAEEREVEISDADPLTDSVFQARSELRKVLDEDDPEPVADGGHVKLGTVTGGSTFDADGEAVLALQGTDGIASVRVPEDMVAPVNGLVEKLARHYSLDLPEVMPDGGTIPGEPEPKGAVDHSFDEAERSTREVLLDEVADVRTAPLPGSVALDLVTRQLLLVRRGSYEDLAAHYEAEGYSLLSYGVHPYLPVTVDDAVYECVYLSDVTAESLANFGDAKTYDFPEGRLAHVPVEEAWRGDD